MTEIEQVEELVALAPTVFTAATVPPIEQVNTTFATAPPEETLACVQEQLSAEAVKGSTRNIAKDNAIFKFFIVSESRAMFIFKSGKEYLR